jgi:hypothetical protein
LIFSEDLVYEYGIHEGANLISFPLISENYDIDYFFSSENTNLFSNIIVEEHITSIITEGQLTFTQGNQWIGSLNEINTQKGYWFISDQELSFLIISEDHSENLYYLHPGGNLISYPFNQEQPYYEAIPFFSDNILAILGENEALLNVNGMFVGSLATFKPGKGYWFIVENHAPFQYNEPGINRNITHNDETHYRDDEILEFNQSTLQSAFFIESIFLSGEQNNTPIELEALCNENIVGHSTWNEEYSDLITMGDDGFDITQNYCNDNQEVLIRNKNNEQILYNLSGNNIWHPNNFELLILSDSDFGDLNYNQYVNISDIVIMIEHIIETNLFNNNHQLLLADINKDNLINVADVILIIDQILDF